MQTVLAAVASRFGYDPTDTANYNTKFRNRVLANLSAERLLMIYGNLGLDGVVAEIRKIESKLG